MKTRSRLLHPFSTIPAFFLLLHCSSSTDSPSLAGESGSSGTSAPTGSGGTNAGGGNLAGGSSLAGAASGGSASGGVSGSASAGGPGQATSAGQGGGGGSPPGGASGSGGNTASGGNAGTAASSMGGGQAGSTSGGSNPGDNSIPMTIPTPSNGQGEIRDSTTVLKNAKDGGKDVWDFGNQRIGVNNTSNCDDGEDQVTVFEVEDGVTVRNLIVAGGLSAGNGIVCKGNCTLEYVYWEDVCEDAATNTKDGATMTLNHVIALHASDKVFQHNAKAGSKTIIQNSYIADFGKLWRSCGDCTDNGGPRHLLLENVRVDGVNTAVAGANQNYGDTVSIHNLYVKGGYDAAKDKPKICTEYIGVTDHNGDSTKVGDGKSQWNTATCMVSQSDVKSY